MCFALPAEATLRLEALFSGIIACDGMFSQSHQMVPNTWGTSKELHSNNEFTKPLGGTPPATHSVSTSPIAARTRKHRHSRQTYCGSARSRPLFARERPNDAGQVGGKVFATQKGLQASSATSKTSENRARTLQNRARGSPESSPEASKTQFFKDT